MITRVQTFFALGLLLLPIFVTPLAAAEVPAWPALTSENRPWTFWWWPGSAVDATNITRSLERFHAAGLGGVHIIPIYGAKGAETNYIDYLSPKWMQMMGWTVAEAKRLGMGVDMTTGSGWCFGGPNVSDEDANSLVVLQTYELKAGEKLKQKFNRKATQALVAFSSDGKASELTDTIPANGEMNFSPTNGNWTIYAISQKPSGQKVKRPAPGGEGWMLNLIYPDAVSRWLQRYTDAFAGYAGPKPRAQYHDSYEYKSDWSPDFFAQFEKLRGYKLQTELPALFGTTADDHAARVKADYRKTVSDVMAGESLPRWVQWSHDHGFITRDQAHGSPGNLLDLYAAADIPETEMFHTDRNKLISKFASSAAHVTGKPLVSAETGTWLAEHFTETLADVKYLADDMFLSGVNHIFYHGNCYSPDEAGWPGWLFYASTEMNPRNSIWHDVSAVNEYIARCQSILQSGQPDNDILLYWPIDDFWMQPGGPLLPHFTVHAREWFENQPIGKTAKELWDKGYAFDYVSDAQLKTAKVVDGKIQMPGGKYGVIVVPECKYLPIETYKQLLALAENGATVIFEKQLPTDVSGENNLEKERAELKSSKTKLVAAYNENHNPGFDGYRVGKGSFYAGSYFPGTKSLEYENAVACEPLVGFGLSFVRRSFDGGWNYFIANRTETNFDGWINFERPASSFVILDPMSGNSGVAASRESSRRVSLAKEKFVSPFEIHLQIKAGESVILRAVNHTLIIDHELQMWNYWQTNGAPTEITGNWNVKFISGGPTLPADSQITKLASWTTFADTNAQAFAGTAKYEITFDFQPSTFNLQPSTVSLNLGDVRQSARVRVNGKDYGTLITPPFRVVVDNLKPKGNKLEVEVTNVSANRIRDLDRRGVPWKIMRDINIVNLNYKPFDASGWSLAESGLLGPVTLSAITAE